MLHFKITAAQCGSATLRRKNRLTIKVPSFTSFTFLLLPLQKTGVPSRGGVCDIQYTIASQFISCFRRIYLVFFSLFFYRRRRGGRRRGWRRRTASRISASTVIQTPASLFHCWKGISLPPPHPPPSSLLPAGAVDPDPHHSRFADCASATLYLELTQFGPGSRYRTLTCNRPPRR